MMKRSDIVFGHIEKGLFWFRLFGGYGLHGKNVTTHSLLFSERQKITRRLQIGDWSFRILKPNES